MEKEMVEYQEDVTTEQLEQIEVEIVYKGRILETRFDEKNVSFVYLFKERFKILQKDNWWTQLLQ